MTEASRPGWSKILLFGYLQPSIAVVLNTLAGITITAWAVEQMIPALALIGTRIGKEITKDARGMETVCYI